MNTENLYDALGVSETATQDEIKKAYRKLVIEHHPDKGGDESKFKKIAHSYDTLGDPNKRAQYDNQRKNPFGNQNGGFNPFEDFFNGGGFYNQRKRSAPEKVIDLTIGVIESYKSVNKTITYRRNIECNTCHGSGGDRKTCDTCKGEGFSTVRVGTGMFVQLMRQVCNTCRGNGYVLTKKCTTCDGNTTKNVTETIDIKLPHGVDEGQFYRLEGKGDFSKGMYGDLILRIKIAPQDNFEKLNNDLVYNAYLCFDDLQKDSLEIPHPSGTVSVKLPKEFDSSKPLRVKGKGFSTNGVGDMFIKLIVKFNRN